MLKDSEIQDAVLSQAARKYGCILYMFMVSKYVDHLQVYEVFEAPRMKELMLLLQRPNGRRPQQEKGSEKVRSLSSPCVSFQASLFMFIP